MAGVAVWLDDFSLRALPGVADALAHSSATVMRSFARVPNPAVVGEGQGYRQGGVGGGRDFTELTARIEQATTTLPIGIIAALPEEGGRTAALRGAGLLDVLPA